MNIRRYRKSDAEGIVNIHTESVERIASKDYSEKEIDAWASKDTEDVKLKETEIRFVAEKDEELIGFSEYNMKEGEITGMYIKPEFTRQGVGKELLKQVEEHAKAEEINRLSCYSTITAKEFYERQGYVVLEKTSMRLVTRILRHLLWRSKYKN